MREGAWCPEGAHTDEDYSSPNISCRRLAITQGCALHTGAEQISLLSGLLPWAGFHWCRQSKAVCFPGSQSESQR